MRRAPGRSGVILGLVWATAATLLPAHVVPGPVGTGAAPLPAQEAAPPEIWLIPKGDTVFLLLPLIAADHSGFLVDRIGADGVLERLTEQPVAPIGDPVFGPAQAGSDMDALVVALRADSEGDALRRLRSDAFAGGAMSFLYRSAARITGRLFVDSQVEEGASYRYRVVFLNRAGEETGEVREGEVTVADRPLAAPGAPEVQVGLGEVEITFPVPPYLGDPDDVGFGYHVERLEGDGERFTRITETPVLRPQDAFGSYFDTSVEYGLPYRYRIRVQDVAGRLSAPSPEVAVVPEDPRPPTPPEGLVTTPGEGEVALRWNLAPSRRVAGYHLERSTGLDQPYSRITEAVIPSETPEHLDQDVIGGTQYFYRVLAVTVDGSESPPGNAISAIPIDRTPPDAVEGLSAEVATRRLSLSWTPSASPDVDGYHVYRGESADRIIRLTERPQPDTTFLDEGFGDDGLGPGSTYLVRVTAVDRSGNESDPSEVVAEVPDDEPPTPPSGLQAVNRQGREVELRWSASTALDVAAYRVYRRALEGADNGDGLPEAGATGSREPIHEMTAGRPPFRWVDGDVTSGASMEYRVIALDHAGNESEAALVTVEVRSPLPPPAPRRATAILMPEGVEVRWERVAAPDLEAYRVFRSPLPTGQWVELARVPASDGTLRYSDMEGDGTHYYMVRAVDRAGTPSRPSPAVRAGSADR